MKFTFIAKNKSLAEKFAKTIKEGRNIESVVKEVDKQFHVEYSVANCCEPMCVDKAQPCAPTYDDLSNLANFLFQELQYQTNYLWAEIDYLSNALYKHVSDGHLPPINGAEKMEKALTALGIGSDYEVKKPVVYASTIEVDFAHKK